jgi:hypothetical protein
MGRGSGRWDIGVESSSLERSSVHLGTRARRGTAGLPNFLIIGAMKSGTTSLYHYLRDHPQVYMASIKELDFFVEGGNWRRGVNWYRRQFEGAHQAVAIGEASTAYSKYPTVPGVPQKIATHLPDVRLIYVVRDPIDRIRSHYAHLVAVGTERQPIEKAVLENPIYLTCSRYASQIEQYLQYFPRKRLLLVTSDDLWHSRQSTLHRVYAFLDVDSGFVPETLTREFLKTGERARYGQAAGWLRHKLKRSFPASKRAKEFIDSSLPRTLNRVLGRRDGEEKALFFRIPEHVRQELAEQLKDDVRRLQTYMPEGFDGWGLA